MNKSEEFVYSSMGLDPILLLEEPPSTENYTVNIIRPGEEIGEGRNNILEPDQGNTLNNNPHDKHRKNNKDIIRLKNNNPIEKKSTNSEEIENVEEEKINVDFDEETNELTIADNIIKNEKNESSSTESQEVNEDPRRKRRRSSASS